MTTGSQTDDDFKKCIHHNLNVGLKRQQLMILSDVLEDFLVTASALRRSNRRKNLLASHAKITKQKQNMLNLLPSFINGVSLAVARAERARQTPS